MRSFSQNSHVEREPSEARVSEGESMINFSELADRALQGVLGGVGKKADRSIAEVGSLGRDRLSLSAGGALPRIEVSANDVGSLFGQDSAKLERVLPDYLSRQRWFAGKTEAVSGVKVLHASKVGKNGYLTMLEVNTAKGSTEVYALGVAATPEAAVKGGAPLLAPLARVRTAKGSYILSDAMGDPSFSQELIGAIHAGKALEGTNGAFKGVSGAELAKAAPRSKAMSVTPLSLETSNTSVRADQPGSSFVLKLTRRHDAQIAPGTPSEALDVWKGSYLTDHTTFHNTPRVYGKLVYQPAKGPQRTVSVLSEFVPNQGDSWSHALAQLQPMLENAGRKGADHPTVKEAIDQYAAVARTHGTRLGQLHVALSSGGNSSEFRPVAPSAQDLAQETAALKSDAAATLDALRRAAGPKGPITARGLTELEKGVDKTVQSVTRYQMQGRPADWIHAHGDFHLGQMLHTEGNDVQIIDLEGAPALPVAERWKRSSALGDVARQRSSYEYAAEQAVRAQVAKGASPEAVRNMRQAADQWAQQAKDAFMAGWKQQTAGRSFVPDASSFDSALRRADFANALYETRYELGSRPDWVGVPLNRLGTLSASPDAGAQVVSLKPAIAASAA